jgi:adenosine deaminase
MATDPYADPKLEGVSIRSLPKVSLHDHLDGALRPQTIIELADEIGLDVPSTDAEELADWFEDQSDSGSLVEYLKTFDLTTAVMQSADGLRRVAKEFVEDLAADGVIYGEVRWAPEQHLGGGLSSKKPSRPCRRASRRARTPSIARVATSASASSSRRCGMPTARWRSPGSRSRSAVAVRSASTSPGRRTASRRRVTAPRSTTSPPSSSR